MLTLEQVAEGRRLVALDVPDNVDARASRDSWLLQHAAELLDAAERVARQEAEAADVTRLLAEPPQVLPGLAAMLRDRRKAEPLQQRTASAVSEDTYARIAELQSDFQAEFWTRPILIDRDARTTNPHAATLPMIEAWYLARGVRCTVELVGRELRFVRATLT